MNLEQKITEALKVAMKDKDKAKNGKAEKGFL